MKSTYWLKRVALVAAVCGVVIFVGAQQGNNSGITKQSYSDTPRKKIKDIDEALQDLERARGELERTLKERDWEKDIKEAMKEIDGDKIKKQIELALQQVDVAKIQADAMKAMKEVDLVKIQAELEKSLSSVDGEKMKAELNKALKEIDGAKMKAEIESSLAKIDMEKIKVEMEKLKEVDMKKLEEELKSIKPEMEKSMKEARESIETAKKELTAYKGFIGQLQEDGLIKKENYTIEYKKGELTINGIKQPDRITKKYSNFLKDRKDFTIKKDADDFNIDND
jgi:hypothetical protein